MKPSEILYTPLDTPKVPNFDIDRLLGWILMHHGQQYIDNRRDASQNSSIESLYPWDIIYARNNKKWQYDFNIEFPELSVFFYSAFGLIEQDIQAIVLLPVKTKFAGIGFWHSDPDSHGLRVYLENQETDEFLLIRPTAEPYDARPNFGIDQSFKDIALQDKILSAKLLDRKQTFYLNNIRAVHAVKSCFPGKLRIAAIISVNSHRAELEQHISDLIRRSAEKYSDYAIYWQPE
jgi:hypothetical protein